MVDDQEVDLGEVASFHKWVQTGDTDLPESWELTVSVVTADGELVETSTTTGSGDGTVYAVSGNGKGTRKASAQAEQQHVPLL